MGFDLCNHFLDLKVHLDYNSQSDSSFGSVKVHSLTLSYTPENMRCESRASLLAHTLASPCFGHEPKARVATLGLQIVGVIKTNWKLFHIYLKIFNIGPISHIIEKNNNQQYLILCLWCILAIQFSTILNLHKNCQSHA